jgi:hypothetical protein
MNTNQEQLAFFHQLGTAIKDWQEVDSALYQVMQAAAHDQPAREIFIAFVTHKKFRMKLRQIDDAMSVNFKDTPLFAEWWSLKGITDNAALERHRLVQRFSHLIQLICLRIAGPAVSSRSKVKHLTDSEH